MNPTQALINSLKKEIDRQKEAKLPPNKWLITLYNRKVQEYKREHENV